MWGNRLGWGISAVMIVAAGFVAYWLYTLGQPTPPTGDLVRAAAHLSLADAAGPLLPPPKPLGDAGDEYRNAIADHKAHTAAYEQLAKSTDWDAAAVIQMKGLDALVAATADPTMDLFRSKPDQIVNYNATAPELDDLEAVGKAAIQAATLASFDKDYDTAKTYATAAIALGRNLYRERVAYDELSTGLSLMAGGAAALGDIAKRSDDHGLLDKVGGFDAARTAEYVEIQKVWKILSGQTDENIAAHAGDFFQLADDPAADPVWRIEAVRRLGRLQLNATRAADNVRAKRQLRQMAADASLTPPLHQAAVSARDISSYENQSQR